MGRNAETAKGGEREEKRETGGEVRRKRGQIEKGGGH